MGNVKFILKSIVLINLLAAVHAKLSVTFDTHIADVRREARTPAWVRQDGRTGDGMSINESIVGIKNAIDYVAAQIHTPLYEQTSQDNIQRFRQFSEEQRTRGTTYTAANWNWVYITEWKWLEMAKNIGDIELANDIANWMSNRSRYDRINITGHDAATDLERFETGMMLPWYLDKNLVHLERVISQNSPPIQGARPPASMLRVTKWQNMSCYVDAVVDFISCMPEFVNQITPAAEIALGPNPNPNAEARREVARRLRELLDAKASHDGPCPTSAPLIEALHAAYPPAGEDQPRFGRGVTGEAFDTFEALVDICMHASPWTCTCRIIYDTPGSVPIEEKVTHIIVPYTSSDLQTALTTYFGQEEVTNDHGAVIRKTTKLSRTEKYIIICRNKPYDVTALKKTVGVFKFPPILTIDPSCWAFTDRAPKPRYRLTAVVMYGRGHYWTEIKDDTGKWWKYDEYHNRGTTQYPRLIQDKERQGEWYSLTDSSIPYWLFYTKI